MSLAFRYRLALDLGATSIGWCLIRLNSNYDPISLVRMGARIFSDGRNPKDGSSLAVTRRLARQMRRRRDRLLKRKNRLMAALIRLGFFPADPDERQKLTELDPYALRKKGLDTALTPSEFARALFHINQRRGFKSNRKTDKAANEGGKLKGAIKRVAELLVAANARSVGEWLADRHERRESVRARLRGQGKNAAYDLYIDRAMIEAEFDAIWAKQAALQPELFTKPGRDELKDILLHQRPLRPVRPGRCSLIPEDERAPLALPMVQRFRMYQEVNNLRILNENLGELPLSLEQRDAVVALLEAKNDVTFTAIRKALKLSGTTKFNLEDAKREKLKGNATGTLLAKSDFFGSGWQEFSHAQQDDIVGRLLNEQSEAVLIAWLQSSFSLDEPTADRIANASLADGYGNLGLRALQRVLPELQKSVITYDKAVVAAGFESHSALSHSEQTGEIMEALPYYGEALQRHVGFGSGDPNDSLEKRYGRIANPTVHIGLNQVKKVVNAIIKRYGNPDEVVIEVARELKLGRERKLDIQREQAEKQKQNDEWRLEIKALTGIDARHLDLQLMRLWVELNPRDVANRRCPYTGEAISINMLFSEETEIDHILPFSRTLDDSLSNKTIALRRANRDKGNRTPAEAFSHSPAGYDYTQIIERAKNMHREKAKRFALDGYERWLKEDKDFLARALNDTAYLSRVAKEYFSLVCPPNRVRVIPGRLTAMLRGKFGLNELLSGNSSKTRDDHRHHAIDAAVIGVTDQGLLQRFAKANADARDRQLTKLVESMPMPWPTYRDQIAAAIQRVIVSHKPDHGFEGGLHNETAYGLRDDGMVVHRVPLSKFGSDQDIEKTEFASNDLKEWLLIQTRGLSGKEFAAKLETISRDHRHRRVRILEKLAVLQIKNGDGKSYKGYLGNSNYCIEIVKDDAGRWQGEVISTFAAYQIVAQHGFPRLRDKKLGQSGKPLEMRLCINDAVSLSDQDHQTVYRIAVITSKGQIAFSPCNEANVDARNRDKNDPFSYVTKYASSLQKAGGRFAVVDLLGQVVVKS